MSGLGTYRGAEVEADSGWLLGGWLWERVRRFRWRTGLFRKEASVQSLVNTGGGGIVGEGKKSIQRGRFGRVEYGKGTNCEVQNDIQGRRLGTTELRCHYFWDTVKVQSQLLLGRWRSPGVHKVR